MLAQHFHDASLEGEKLIITLRAGHPLAFGRLEDLGQAVGKRFVRTEDAEVALLTVEFDHIAQEHTELMRIRCAHRSG